MPAFAVVVPPETIVKVIRDADVVARWLTITAEDVDDSFLHAMHAGALCTARTEREMAEFRYPELNRTQKLRTRRRGQVARTSTRVPGRSPCGDPDRDGRALGELAEGGRRRYSDLRLLSSRSRVARSNRCPTSLASRAPSRHPSHEGTRFAEPASAPSAHEPA